MKHKKSTNRPLPRFQQSMAKKALLLVILTAFAAVVSAQSFPLWERILKNHSGTTDDTPVPSMKMGHMQMSLKADAAPADPNHATEILDAAAAVLVRYRDVKTAERDGYKPFFPSGKIGEEIHYTNYRYRRLELQHVEYSQPSSILYKRTVDGLKAVGVMYIAPVDSTQAQLNAIAPLSVATWHRHVDFCGGPKDLPKSEQFGSNSRFGPQGSIHTKEECDAAKGLWIPVVLEWMTHVYPNEPQQWGGMNMGVETGG